MTKMDVSFKFHLSLLTFLGLLITLASSGPPSSSSDVPGAGGGGGGVGGGGTLIDNSALIAQFVTLNETFGLKHMAIDPLSGRVYVGSVNRLYELDTNLRLEETVPTGPKLDNPNCHATGCGLETDANEISLTNNVNKVLLVDSSSRTLISCGSVAQGACHKYNLTNITLPPEFAPHAVAANDEVSSTFAFIGPAKYNMWATHNVLYVGTTFTHKGGDYRHDVPAISSRNLYNFDYAEYSFAKQSMLLIDVKYRDHFLVKYVYGFNASDYAYFMIVQKQSYLHGFEEQGYVSRLARTCITDANYDSYTEVTLQCTGGANGNVNFNLVQDAKIIPAKDDLARSLGVNKGELVLVAVFAQSKGITNEPQSESAVCVYSMREIEAKFTENIHMCFNGSVENRNMDYISGPILDGKCYEPGVRF
jgi:plexin A